jgi:hypothetical protein
VNVHAPADTLRFLKGTPRQYVKTGSSGAKRVHAFCAACGSPVFSADPVNPKTCTLRVGALAEREALGPVRRQIWTWRRLHCLLKPESAPEFEGQP